MRNLFKRTKTRHQILGRKLHATLEYTLSSLAKSDAEYMELTSRGQPQQQFDRETAIGKSLTYAVLEHLGYGPIEYLKLHLDRGMDRALEYFFSDWWVGDEDDARALDKSRPDRALHWYGVLPESLLLGGLTSRWSDLSKICSWFDESIETEYQGGLHEDEYQLMFLCIASDLSPTRMSTAGEMLALVKNSRSLRPRLLCALWEAARGQDQRAFEKALRDSVEYFLKHDAQDVPNVRYWVALHQSFLWLLAEKNGLKFPSDLPKEVDAAIVRRQTIGQAKE